VNSAGDSFVTGSVDTDATANISNDFVTLKYDTAGTLKWSQIYVSSASNDVSKAIVEDAQGNVIVTGYSESIPQKDGVTIKYNSLGVQQWEKLLMQMVITLTNLMLWQLIQAVMFMLQALL